MSNVLSAGRKKTLRNLHPLYARISGDVVWALLEENGYDTAACDSMMDSVFAQLANMMNIMDGLERGIFACFMLESSGKECSFCKQLLGRVIPVTRPEWRAFLPPFAIGCTVTCKAFKNSDAPTSAPLPSEFAPPACHLLCPLLVPMS